MYVLVLWSLCLFTLHAQISSGISGEVVTSAGVDASRFTVEIISLNNISQSPERVLVNPQGRFEVRNLTPGSYQFRVYDDRGAVVGSAVQTAGSQYGNVEIRVNTPPRNAHVPRTISIHSLRKDPNGKAEDELQQALWYVRDKNWKSAVKHFEKSVRADETYSRASANWAALELQLGNAAKAEEISRKGLVHDPKDPKLLHGLGASLVAQGIYNDEVVDAFVAAGAQTPKTYLAAAQVEYKRGAWAKARKYAEAYLRTGDPEYKAFAEKLKALPNKAP